jgi:hypothetical protein
MAESDISLGLLLFLLCEFFVGAIVGASIAKDQASGPRGMKIAAALALAVFVYLMVVGTLATPRMLHGPRPLILNLLGVIISSLTLGFCLWLICVLVACAGYWSAFIYFRHLGIGPNRITLASLFAFITILAAVTALMQLSRR